MRDVARFVRPLGWVLDLDVRGDEARTVAEVLAWMPRPKRAPTWTYRAVALRCQIVAELVVSDDVRRELLELAERCGRLQTRAVSLAGTKLVARGDEAARIALRKLTRDARILERLGLWPRTARAEP